LTTKLPIVETISYSGLSNFELCPKYFELVNVKKLRKEKSSEEMAFGTLSHKYIQAILLDAITPENAVVRAAKTWKRLCSLYKITDIKYLNYTFLFEKILPEVLPFFEKNFGKIEVIGIEWELKSKIVGFPQNFKGFIDLIFKRLDTGEIIIADLKTASSVYFFKEYQNAKKDAQLVLYKKFYSELENINPENIKLCFVVLEKNIKSKNPISYIDVPCGNVKAKNAEEWLEKSLTSINKEVFRKNFTACHRFGRTCEFYKSENCSRIIK
jgi:hypothetical protein